MNFFLPSINLANKFVNMPYPNEHSARIKDPNDFEEKGWSRKNITDGVDIILGHLKGEDTTTTQAYRFDALKFTAEEAKKWCKDNDVHYISFEAATNAQVVEGHIFVYGEIVPFQDEKVREYGGVNLKDIVNQINNNKEATRLIVHIHSPGGDVWEGFAIHDALVNSGKEIETIIEGLCASISTVVALSGDRRLMTQHSEFMIHNPWTFAIGDSEDLKKQSDELAKTENKLAEFYSAKTNLKVDKLLDYMHNETFFTAEEAKEFGFITEVVNTMKQVACIHKLKSNINTMSDNKEMIEKLNGFEKFLQKIFAKFQRAIMVADVNGKELEFPELTDPAEIKVDAKCTEGGNPASGDYPMTDGKTFVCAAGVLTEIKPKPVDDTEVLKTENTALKAEIETLKAGKVVFEAKATEAIAAMNKAKTEFKNFKAQFSTGNPADGRPPIGDPDDKKISKNEILKILNIN